MERTISREDRIKRAEELYYRRKNAVNVGKTTTVNVNPKNITLTLKSGDAAYIYCGNSLAELAPSFNSRFRAERARYLLQADIANGFGINFLMRE